MTDINAPAQRVPEPELAKGEPASNLTAREHAAIQLRVPDSGTDWLDAMIRTSLRQEFAKAAMQGICADPDMPRVERTAEISVEAADALLAELEKGK